MIDGLRVLYDCLFHELTISRVLHVILSVIIWFKMFIKGAHVQSIWSSRYHHVKFYATVS